jgi:hypothetical protein
MWPSDCTPDGGVSFCDQRGRHFLGRSEPDEKFTPRLNVGRFDQPRHLGSATQDRRVRAGGQHRGSATMISVVMGDDDLLDVVEVETV